MTSIIASNKIWRPSLQNNLETRTSKKFITITEPSQLTEEFLFQLQPKYIFFSHWSHFISPAIFTRYECIIFHMTDLPFGRGGSPLQNLIAQGIYQTQVTALRCAEELDSGPIYLKKPLSLQGKAQDIYELASLIIEDMIVEIIQQQLTPNPQEGNVVTFSRRKPEQSNLATLSELQAVYDYIRMLDADTYPNAFLETDHFIFEFSRATLKDDKILADVIIKLKKEQNVESDSSNSSTPG